MKIHLPYLCLAPSRALASKLLPLTMRPTKLHLRLPQSIGNMFMPKGAPAGRSSGAFPTLIPDSERAERSEAGDVHRKTDANFASTKAPVRESKFAL